VKPFMRYNTRSGHGANDTGKGPSRKEDWDGYGIFFTWKMAGYWNKP